MFFFAYSKVNNKNFKKNQAPEPIEQWDKVFDATRDGPMCPQPTEDLTEVSEDCLRLNIYTHDVNF